MTALLTHLQSPIAALGASVIAVCAAVGRLTIFMLNGVWHAFTPRYYPRETLKQLMRIGYYSLPVVGLTALFTGAVLVLQIYVGGSRFNAESVAPSIAGISITRELGPVLAALMVAGRVSAAIAAELGAMRVTEQIDALVTLSTNPFKYLVAPRLIAATIAMPLLVGVADIIGIMGGFLVGTERLNFNPQAYITNTVTYIETLDVVSGLVKAAVFGFIIALMGCYNGYTSGRGAQGVGRATTNAVVSASVMILAANYVLTEAFFSA